MTTKTKVFLVGAVAVVGIVFFAVLASGGLHGHGPQAFLNKMEDAGFYNRAGDSAALGRGYDICEALDTGRSHTSVVQMTYTDNDISYAGAEKLVGIAEDYLC